VSLIFLEYLPFSVDMDTSTSSIVNRLPRFA
jgi:hypothetical protein